VFVALPGHQFLAPDIAWWSSDRRPAVREGALDVVPDLVVEVVSPATRANDLGIKRSLYLEVGACELWLADPSLKALVRARPLAPDQELSEDAILATNLLNGFSVHLSRVFSAA
jgi:Uma2 family endonuclease